MGLSLERKVLLTARSDRVKCVDFHPTEPWVLCSLYSGVVSIWNYQTQTMIKSIEVSEFPIRTARFVARKNWIITGADDLVVRVFNYNTTEKVASFDGHSDYIRALAIHPTRSYFLSCSDDMTIKLWDWDKNWKCITTYEGHSHYVMSVVFNPKDPNTFATGSLDRTIKIWSIASPNANYTLEGHEKGINTIDYYGGTDKPYIVSGADDFTVRVWDYQTKACVRILEGHLQNVSSVCFHPELPIILSGGEDGCLKVWNSSTFRMESSFSFGLERIWNLAVFSGSNEIGLGCDEGTIVLQLGKSEPAASMDGNGKVIWSKHHTVFTGSVRMGGFSTGIDDVTATNTTAANTATSTSSYVDGEKITVSKKELGSSEIYPQMIQHSPNGRFVVVLGDGEYVVYTAVAWRNKSFGKALDFCWGPIGTNDYAVKDGSSKLSIFQNFAETGTIKVGASGIAMSIEKLFGGTLLGVGYSGAQLCLYDWTTCELVRRIDVEPTRIYWSEQGRLAICTADTVYILRYVQEAFHHALNKSTYSEEVIPEDGVEEAIEFIGDLGDTVVSGCWVGEAFVFVNKSNRIGYWIGGETYSVAMYERSLFILGYLGGENRIYLCDKDANVVSFEISLTVLEYESAILEGEEERAHNLLGAIPESQKNRVANFLESQGKLEDAINMATDPDYRFELALLLGKLDVAYELASEYESVHKWRQLGDRALTEWKVALAEKCFVQGEDLNSLLLLYATSGNTGGLAALAQMALEQNQINVAFTCYFIIGQRKECLNLLVQENRIAEAAMFARCYVPSSVERIIELWREQLKKSGHIYGSLLADPVRNGELFPEFDESMAAEATIIPCTLGSAGTMIEEATAKSARSVSFESGGERKMSNASGTNGSVFMMPGQTSQTLGIIGNNNNSSNSSSAASHHGAFGQFGSLLEEQSNSILTSPHDAISDHMSMEVNTTGTGSIKAEDIDEMISMRSSEEISSGFGGGLTGSAKSLERLSIHDEQEEFRLEEDEAAGSQDMNEFNVSEQLENEFDNIGIDNGETTEPELNADHHPYAMETNQEDDFIHDRKASIKGKEHDEKQVKIPDINLDDDWN